MGCQATADRTALTARRYSLLRSPRTRPLRRSNAARPVRRIFTFSGNGSRLAISQNERPRDTGDARRRVATYSAGDGPRRPSSAQGLVTYSKQKLLCPSGLLGVVEVVGPLAIAVEADPAQPPPRPESKTVTPPCTALAPRRSPVSTSKSPTKDRDTLGLVHGLGWAQRERPSVAWCDYRNPLVTPSSHRLRAVAKPATP